MSALPLNGNALAKKIRQSLAPRVEAVKKARGRAPRLAIIAAAGASTASYLQAKAKASREAGIEAEIHPLPEASDTHAASQLLWSLAQNAAVDAIIVDLPLPKAVHVESLVAALPAEKDVEGITPHNYGRLFLAKTCEEARALKLIAPPTALAIVELLKESGVPVAGQRAVVVGRSNIVGKPAAHLLTAMNATVALCHSKTADLAEEVRRADIVVACLGKARLIKGSWLKSGAVVIDAGVNEEGGKLCGDVDFAEAEKVASFITPVPGGVGPVTTAMLLSNAVQLAERRLAKD